VRKVNLGDIDWRVEHASPTGKFRRFAKPLSEALGRDPASTDLDARHPFDVAIARVPSGALSCPYHLHSAQWEFFHVIAGEGTVRHSNGTTPIKEGDAFVFKPGEPHHIKNDGSVELIYLVIADNPFGEVCYYPDSGKWGYYSESRTWAIESANYRIMRSEPLDYFDGEE